MSPKTLSVEARLADGALRLLARQSWPELTLAAVARSAKLPLATLRAHAASKSALIGLILQRTGDQAAARYKKDRSATHARDRVFDVAVTWFDVLAPHKAAFQSLYDGLARDPLTLAGARGAFLAHAEWLLVLAEADTGRVGAIKAAVLAVLLTRTIPVWLKDEKDLGKTMARLDEGLRRAGVLF